MKRGWMVGFLFIALLLLGTSIPLALAGEAGSYSTIVVKEFSLEGAAIQENEDTKAFAQTLPPDFAQMVKSYLESMKASQNVLIEQPGKEEASLEKAVVVEGRFTKITAGSTAARIAVGFGAGASTVGAEWTVKEAGTGKILGKSNRNQHTGGGYRGITALEADSRYLAKYVASSIIKLLK